MFNNPPHRDSFVAAPLARGRVEARPSPRLAAEDSKKALAGIAGICSQGTRARARGSVANATATLGRAGAECETALAGIAGPLALALPSLHTQTLCKQTELSIYFAKH